MAVRFTHDATVTITFALPAHPEAEPEHESTEVNVRLHLAGTLGTPESNRFGPAWAYDPGSPAEVELERFEIEDGHDLTGKSIWRRPYKLSDATIATAVDSWVEDHQDELIAAMGGHVEDAAAEAAERRADLEEDRRFLESL